MPPATSSIAAFATTGRTTTSSSEGGGSGENKTLSSSPYSSRRSNTSRQHNLPLNLASLEGQEGLIGRQNEVAILQKSWQRVISLNSNNDNMDGDCDKEKSLSYNPQETQKIWVEGASGCGKSTLVVRTMEDIMADRNDHQFFVSGKFEQTSSDKPLSAIAEAMTQLCDALALSPILQEIQSRLQETFSKAELRILSNFLPSIGRIVKIPALQEQAIVTPMAAIQSEFAFQRFCDVFKVFWRIICYSPACCVCLFVDDLQWADKESQHLLQVLANDNHPHPRHLLLIGATRQTEKEPFWKSSTKIKVDPLSAESCNQVVSILLDCRAEKTVDLSDLVHKKTQGNPFFLIQYLELLHSRNFLRFNFPTGQWNYELEEITANTDVSDNVVDLLMEKMKAMPPAVQSTLRVAACLGFHFESAILDEIMTSLEIDLAILEEDTDTTAKDLSKPETAPEVPDRNLSSLPMKNDQTTSSECGRALEIAASNGLIEPSPKSFKFSHDRVQQAALALLPAGQEGKYFRLKLGVTLLQLYHQTPDKDWMLFSSVDHLLDYGYGKDEEAKAQDLAEACLEAGSKAQIKSAFEAAARYADRGLMLLCGSDPLCWQKENTYSLCLGLCTLLSQASYSHGDYDKSDMAAKQAITNAKRLEDKLLPYKVRIAIFGSRGDLHGGAAEGLNVLEQLGIKLPLKPNDKLVGKNMKKISQMMKGRTPTDLAKLPMMTDQQHIESMRFLHTNTVYSWHAGEANLCVLQCLTMMQLTLDHGLCQFSPHAITVYGGLQTMTGELDGAFEYAKVALELLERPDCRDEAPITLKVVHLFLYHLKKPLYESLDPLLEGYKTGMETGDIQIASRILCLHAILCVIAGMPIGNLLTQLEGYCEFFREYRQHDCLMEISPWLQFTRNLIGDGHEPTLVLSGSVAEEEELANIGQQEPLLREDLTIKLYTVTARIMLFCVFGDFQKSYEECSHIKVFENITYSFFMKPFLIFFSGFTYLCLAKDKKLLEKRSLIKKGRAAMKELKKFVKGGSSNYVPMLLLLEAEDFALSEGTDKVLKTYQSAIATAGRSGFRLIKAIACERAGQYWLRRQDKGLASDYFSRAAKEFAEYGAQAKAADIEDKYEFELSSPFTASSQKGVRRSSLALQPTNLSHIKFWGEESSRLL